MKAELLLRRHAVIPGQKVVEVWYDGALIGTVTGADGPGVRVISKHMMQVSSEPMVTTVMAKDPARG